MEIYSSVTKNALSTIYLPFSAKLSSLCHPSAARVDCILGKFELIMPLNRGGPDAGWTCTNTPRQNCTDSGVSSFRPVQSHPVMGLLCIITHFLVYFPPEYWASLQQTIWPQRSSHHPHFGLAQRAQLLNY